MVFPGSCIRIIPCWWWKETLRLLLMFPSRFNTMPPPPRFQRIGYGKVVSQSLKGFLQVPQPSNLPMLEDQEIIWKMLWQVKEWLTITISMQKSTMITEKAQYGTDAKYWCNRIWKVCSQKVTARYSSSQSSWGTTVGTFHRRPCHLSYPLPTVGPLSSLWNIRKVARCPHRQMGATSPMRRHVVEV